MTPKKTKTQSIMDQLLAEFKELKKKIFPDGVKFVTFEDTPEQRRYDQLLQFFFPQFRTDSYVSPVPGVVKVGNTYSDVITYDNSLPAEDFEGGK